MQPDVRALMTDMLESVTAIQVYTSGLSYEAYEAERLVQDAVEHRFMIIGEALNQALALDPALESAISQTRNIIGLRNRIVHAYSLIESETLWTVIHRYLPALREELNTLLDIKS